MRMFSRESFYNGNPFILSFLLFLTALTLRLYMVFSANIITPDGIQYIEAAKMIASGNFQKISTFSFFNLYPFLIAAFQKVFYDWEMAGRLVSAIIGSLAVVPFFLLIRELIDNRVAFMATLFYVISPRLIEYSSDVLREPSFWFFAITSLYCGWIGLARNKWLLMASSSLFAGMATLTRLEGLSLFLVMPLWIVWYCLSGARDLRRLFTMILVFTITLLVVSSPFLLASKKTLGRLELGFVGQKVPQLLTDDLERSLQAKHDILNLKSPSLKSFLDMATRHKYEVFFSEGVYKFVKSLHPVFFLLLLFGAIKRKYIPYTKSEIPFLVWFLVFFLTVYAYTAKTCYLSTRHGLLMGVPALMWVSIGFFELKERLACLLNTRSLKAFTRYIAGSLIVIILMIVLPNALKSSGKDKVELKQAGIYLKELGYSQGKYIVQPSLFRVAFYAGIDFITLHNMVNPYDMLKANEITSFAVESKAKYLMVDGKTINEYVPGFKEDLDPAKFERVSLPQLENFKEYSIVVYKIKDK